MRYILLFLYLTTCAQAQTLILGWEYDAPAPERFILSLVDHQGTVATLTVEPSKPGACARIPEAGPQTFCASWPQCLTPGVWVFIAQAESHGIQSPTSPPLTCRITQDNLCGCAPEPLQIAPPVQTQGQASIIPTPPHIPDDVKALLHPVPATAPGKALAGPELLREALNVTAPAIQMPGGT